MKRPDLSVTMLYCLILISALSWGSTPVDTIIIDRQLETRQVIDSDTRIFVDSSGDLGISEIQNLDHSQAFTPLIEFDYPDKYERGKYAYWLQAIVRNNSSGILQVGLDNGVFDSIRTYVESPNCITHSKAYGNRTISNDDGIYLNTTTPITLESGVTYRLLTRFANDVEINRPIEPQLVNIDYHEKTVLNRLITVFGIQITFLTILLIVSLINIFQFVQSREREFLYYSLYTFSILVFFTRDVYCASPIVVFDLMPLCSNGWISPLLLASFMLYMLFMKAFLNVKEKMPLLHKMINVSLVISVIYLIIERSIYFFDPFMAWELYGYFKVFFLIAQLGFIAMFARSGNRLSFFILFGTLVLVLGTLATALMSFRPVHFVGYMDVTYIPQYVAIVIELLFFSIGLGYKVKLNEYEKRKAQSDLALKNKEVEYERELSNVKSSFFAQITHDFRTPLTLINNSLLQIGGNDRIKKLIRRNSDHLLELINQILETNFRENVKQELAYIHNDVAAFIQYCLESFELSDDLKNRKLQFEAHQTGYKIDFDPLRLRRIFHNLLDNAIKFTEVGDRITLRVLINDIEETWSLEVEDSGIGMSPTEKEQIFKMYFHISEKEGYGIGLSTVQRYVELMKGTVTVDSISGKGSLFRITLPITHQGQDLPWEVNPSTDSENSTNDNHQTLSLLDDPELPLMLIVEDNVALRDQMIDLLAMDYRIVSSVNGKEAVDSIEKFIPDIIVSDVMMPIMDGLQLLDYVKGHQLYRHIPMILLTAKAGEQNRIDGISHGADAYITKPFNIEELKLRCRNLIIAQQYVRDKYLLEANLKEPDTELDREEVGFLNKLNQMIENQLTQENYTTAMMAKDLGSNHVSLNKRIKLLTGLTTSAYVRKYKLKKAKTLLLKGTMSVSEVCYDVGMSEPGYFSKLFKKEFGYLPSEVK